MKDFFSERLSWCPPGRENLQWQVLPGPAVTDQLFHAYRELTHRPGLVPVQPRWMHITIQHVGPLAGLTVSEMDAIVARVRRRCARLPAFTITVGAARVWDTGVVAPARPVASLHQVWNIALTASHEVIGDRFEIRPVPSHLPHLSLAYSTAAGDPRPLRAWLSERDPATLPIRVSQLHLVTQRHDRGQFTGRVLDTVPLVRGRKQAE
jgi:2'-5' RNA ligase